MSLNASETKLCAWPTPTLDNNSSLESTLEHTLHNGNDHIQSLLIVLLETSPAKLCNLLKSLGAKHNNCHHLAETIAKVIPSNLSSSLILDSGWMLPIATDEMNAKDLAYTIVTQVFSALHKVPFSALVKAACGRQSCAVTELFEEVEAICLKIRQHIENTNEPKDIYMEVLEVIPDNPLASWVISSAVSKPWPPENQPDLTFILLPIQELFADRELPLIAMLKRLLLLAALYKEKVGNNENFTWTDFTFLEHIGGNSPMEVSKIFTDDDVSLFRELCVEDFLVSSPRLRGMSSRWSELASVVKACCIVYGKSGIVDSLSRISKCLIDRRNYYSATAFLTGIQNAGYSPKSLSDSLNYIDPGDQYAFYMREWSERPGLPFLFPHISRLIRCELLKFKSYGQRSLWEENRAELLSELLKFNSYGQRSSWEENDASDLEGNAWNELNVDNVDVYQRRVLAKIYYQSYTIFGLAKSALYGATQYLIGCLSFSDKSPLVDIEKGGDMAKSTEDKNVMDCFPSGRELQGI